VTNRLEYKGRLKNDETNWIRDKSD